MPASRSRPRRRLLVVAGPVDGRIHALARAHNQITDDHWGPALLRALPYDLGGRSSVAYKPTGVEATFTIPARHVSEPRSSAGPAIKIARPSAGHPVAPPPRMRTGHDVLLVEDSRIIALDAEDVANRLGADTVLPAATAEAALDAIDARPPTVAILDINFGDRNSVPIADRLTELGVPFLLATGYGEEPQLPPQHRDRLVVQKPDTLENLARSLAERLGIPGNDGVTAASNDA